MTKGSPDQVDQVKAHIESAVIPKVTGLHGFRGAYWLIDRATGEGLTFGFYETKEDLDASRAQVTQMRDSAVQSFGGTVTGVDEFEVTASTGEKVHQGASHARVTEVDGDPANFDQSVRVVNDSVIPAVKGFAGLVGGFWLGDRETGKGLAVTLFDSEGSMAASRETANALRQRAAADAGGTIGVVREYEILTRAATPAGVAAG
jgi:hypothetical protein